MIDNWDGIHYCVVNCYWVHWNIIDKKLYVFSSSAFWNNTVSTWFDWMSFWMFYREICKMRSSPCCSQYCPPAGRQGEEGGFSCEEKQTGKKPSDFTFANARGKTHITAVFGFNFNRFQNLGHRQHNHWITKPDEAKLIYVWLNWCHSWRKWDRS